MKDNNGILPSITFMTLLKISLFSLSCFYLLTNCSNKKEQTNNKSKQPNILLIVADDLGYTDLGCYGSEIKTPNIDALAQQSTVLTSFYTGPTCSPTRGMLLTGTDAHRNGFGTMIDDWSDNQLGLRGYEGYLNFDVVTFPKLLQDAGYHTSIAGKWHLGIPPKKEQWPFNRGFTRSFCLLPGGGGHFYDKQPFLAVIPESAYCQDSSFVGALPEDFYSTKNYADKAIEYINESQQQDQPFFHFLSYTAPHWPLQVPDDYVDLYKGQYEEGYEKLAQSRLAKAKKAGVIPDYVEVPPLSPNVLPWTELTDLEQRKASKSMELYAAMIERLDFHTGRVIQHLKEIGAYENTLIIFMADNGAEGNSIMGYANTGEWVDTTFDNSLANMGKQNSYVELGTGWAQVSSLPFKWYKAFATEGGVRAPAMIHYPKGKKVANGINDNFVSVKDLAPTFLELAEVQHPQTNYKGREILPMDGESMLPWLMGKSETVHPKDKAHAWELYGRRGLRKGNWKLEWMEKPYGNEEWELYDLSKDISQQHNLAATLPEKLAELVKAWEIYEKENNVTLPNRPTAYAKETIWRGGRK